MTEKDIDAKLSRQPIERYQWPLGAALVCFAASMLVGERRRGTRPAGATRRVVAAGAAVLLLASGGAVEAKNSGVTAYEKEDFQGARETFDKQLRRQPDSEALHFNSGAAAYKAGEYDRALESFARAVTSPDPRLRAKAEYNLANTLYQRGAGQKERDAKLQEWRGALQHYDEALKVDAKDENATYNRDLVRKLIEELEKQPPQDQDQKKQDKQDQKEKKDKQDNKDRQDQQKQSGEEQKDGEQKDGEEKEGGEKKDGEPQQPKDGKDGKDGKPKSGDQKGEEEGGEKGAKKDEKKDGKSEQSQPGEQEKKKEGEMQAAPQYGKDREDPAREEAANLQAAAEGKMTEQQAMALLESLKAEDDKVQLRERTERRPDRAFRNW